jgi:hypothetical protein
MVAGTIAPYLHTKGCNIAVSFDKKHIRRRYSTRSSASNDATQIPACSNDLFALKRDPLSSVGEKSSGWSSRHFVSTCRCEAFSAEGVRFGFALRPPDLAMVCLSFLIATQMK